MTARAWGALATLYVVWGSTYLGIMLAIRTMPPFLMSSARFLVAGGFLFALSTVTGDVVSDPFRATGDLVDLLRLRSSQLDDLAA